MINHIDINIEDEIQLINIYLRKMIFRRLMMLPKFGFSEAVVQSV